MAQNKIPKIWTITWNTTKQKLLIQLNQNTSNDASSTVLCRNDHRDNVDYLRDWLAKWLTDWLTNSLTIRFSTADCLLERQMDWITVCLTAFIFNTRGEFTLLLGLPFSSIISSNLCDWCVNTGFIFRKLLCWEEKTNQVSNEMQNM